MIDHCDQVGHRRHDLIADPGNQELVLDVQRHRRNVAPQ